jgi:adenylate cyclase
MIETPAIPGRETRRAKPRSRSGWKTAQRWRLASGLVLFTFVLTHFLNHALGHVSVDAMEAVQEVRRAVWRSWPGTVLLYGALTVHVALALGALVGRRTWRMARWEALQIAFGLMIPALAVAHVMATRGVSAVAGFDDTYTAELRILWPGLASSQSILLIVVWLHAMIGFHHWLRTKSWYSAWQPALLVGAVLVPTLAITGWIAAARRLSLKSFDAPPMTGTMLQVGGELIETGQMAVWTVLLLSASFLVARRLTDWFRVGPTVLYSGGRKVKGTAGATLLEISRAAGVPHAAICGGRGRCTTCRVMVLEGLEGLPPPNTVEAAALERIDAPPGVRLACQIRPEHELKVRPLIHHKQADTVASTDAFRWGVERKITVMFSDLRSFTTLAERLYPYDSVFLLNRYFEVMSDAIERHGGEVDKFLGDGIMALFGVAPARGSGARDAILASRDMLAGLEKLNAEFETTLPEPLRMGIGLHLGPVVLGRVGGVKGGLTALGDTVNIASRLEALNKELGSTVVISEDVVRASKLILEDGERREVPVRGRAMPLAIVVINGLVGLENPTESQGAMSGSRP